MLSSLFRQIGFSERETEIYLGLAALGKTTAQTLSRKLKLPRATVYGLLSQLVDKGVILREQSRTTTYFSPAKPESFIDHIEEKKSRLQEEERAAKELTEEIRPHLTSNVFSVPKLQFFEGRQKIERMLYQYQPEWRKSYARTNYWTMWGYQDHTFVDHYRKWHEHAWETRDPNEKICLFSNAEGAKQQRTENIPNREIRPLPAGIHFSSSIWIHGDFIILGVTRSTPHYAVVLIDPVFAANLRTVFEMLWKLTTPARPTKKLKKSGARAKSKRR